MGANNQRCLIYADANLADGAQTDWLYASLLSCRTKETKSQDTTESSLELSRQRSVEKLVHDAAIIETSEQPYF